MAIFTCIDSDLIMKCLHGPYMITPAKSEKAACIMLMIQNNLDPNVAQFPHELVTYGGNGSVLSELDTV